MGEERNRIMGDSDAVSFVASTATAHSEVKPDQNAAAKSMATLRKERDQLDQEIAQEIAELGAVPKGVRRARRWLDRLVVWGAAAAVAGLIYAIATLVRPPETDRATSDTELGDEVDSMMDARRRLMRGGHDNQAKPTRPK